MRESVHVAVVECVEDSIVDSSGQSCYYPYCIDGMQFEFSLLLDGKSSLSLSCI